MTTFKTEVPTVDYELCEACEASMMEAGVFGLTTQEMFDQQAQFAFDLALILMQEGHDLVRASQKDKKYSVKRLVDASQKCDEQPKYKFACIHEDKVVSYISFTDEDILASDWTIAKLKEENQEEQRYNEFEVDLSSSQGEQE